VDSHLFDRSSRVPAELVDDLECQSWKPPVIDEGGHLVYAQAENSARRDPAAQARPGAAGGLGEDATSTTEAQAAATGHEEGFAKGKVEGFAAGKKEGLAAATQEANQQMQRQLAPKLEEFNRLLTSLAHSLNEEDYKLEQAMLQMVQCIAEGVIRRELQLEPGQIMKVIKETIAALPPSRDNITIMLNPADKKIADQAISHGGENWRVVADEEVTVGGCKIETEQSLADFTVESRMQTVLDQIQELQAIRPRPGDPGYEEAPAPAITASSESKARVISAATDAVEGEAPVAAANVQQSGADPASDLPTDGLGPSSSGLDSATGGPAPTNQPGKE
jgi:flagellar assembly protein FliH